MNKSIFLHNCRPFVEEVEKQRYNTTSYIDAYEKVEQEYESVTGFRRYSDYENFKTARKRVKRKC